MKMHARKVLQTVSKSLTLAIITSVLAGCAGPGYKKGNAAAIGVQNAAAQVQAERRSLDLTVGALHDLVNEPNGDLRQPYRHYCDSLNRFVAEARRTDDSGRRMAQRDDAYLRAWDQDSASIEYQHVRDLSQTRKTEVASQFDAVHRRYDESQAAVQPLIAYLEDIRKALGADLTPAGVASLKDVVQNAETNAAKVQTALAGLTTALNDSGASMSSLAFQHTNNQATP